MWMTIPTKNPTFSFETPSTGCNRIPKVEDEYVEIHPPHLPRRAGHAAVAANLDLQGATGTPKSPA